MDFTLEEFTEMEELAPPKNQNMFEQLLSVTKYCSLGQLTEATFEVGGQYRRNMWDLETWPAKRGSSKRT